ncbi:MAG: PBP1A family penicillin-binding protein [Oligoflexia bacterium]|nr:PBP1A family penicillin-binding protein [Oligoflexia bacterium]
MKGRVVFGVKIFLLTVLFFGVFSALAGMGIFLHFSRNLPKIITIEDYKPRVVSEVFDRNGVKIGEFCRERREIIPYSKIPTIIIQAFISSEDDKFFEHKGIDFAGISRAMIANFKSGRFTQGGSTITQQVARSLLLTPEKKISRKIKEAILASRIENNLTKEQILFLYLNQIFLGHRAYGVQSAAKLYFNKDVSELTLSEAALLAGLPQAPSKWSPFANPDKAKERQIYVLSRMVQEGYITKEEAIGAVNKRLKLYRNNEVGINKAPYFTEFVRRYLVSKYGIDAVLDDGLKVYTTVDADLQIAGQEAVRHGLKELDKRQGYKGPLEHLQTDEEIRDELERIHKEIIESRREFIYFPEKGYVFKVNNSMFKLKVEEDTEEKTVSDLMSEPVSIDEGTLYRAVVLSVDDEKGVINIGIANIEGVIPKQYYRWAHARNLSAYEYAPPFTSASQILRRGDVILVTQVEPGLFALEQEPEAESGIFSFDITTGHILTMVGGYSYDRSEYNAAYQAKRQAGSTIKPIIYSAAIDNGFTPASIIVDSPIVYGDDEEEGKWKPQNYGEKFYGDTTLRDALIHSRNIPTTKILKDIKIPYAIEYARKLGLREPIRKDLSIGLGTMDVSLWEITKVYSVFASGGKRVIPVFIKRIEDRNGQIIEELDKDHPVDVVLSGSAGENSEAANDFEEGVDYAGEYSEKAWEQVISPQTAYIMTYLLREVVQYGTGRSVRGLRVPVAGKTGTSDDFADAWFVGFTTRIATGVWVGFADTQRTMGRGETGYKAASPIWLEYMNKAVENSPDEDFEQPEGIKLVKIDAETGRIASKYSNKVIYEPFKEGTEPREVEGERKVDEVDEIEFFRDDYSNR